MRISPFRSAALSIIALSLGAPLAAEEITFDNRTDAPWTLVWYGPDGQLDPTDPLCIKPKEQKKINFVTEGTRRARIFDGQREDLCTLEVTHGGVPGGPALTTLNLVPEEEAKGLSDAAVQLTSPHTVTFMRPFLPGIRRVAPPNQKLEYKDAKAAGRPAMPAPAANTVRALRFE